MHHSVHAGQQQGGQNVLRFAKFLPHDMHPARRMVIQKDMLKTYRFPPVLVCIQGLKRRQKTGQAFNSANHSEKKIHNPMPEDTCNMKSHSDAQTRVEELSFLGLEQGQGRDSASHQ